MKQGMDDVERHRLADAREAGGVCCICVRPHSECDCVRSADGLAKTRRDVYEDIQRRSNAAKET